MRRPPKTRRPRVFLSFAGDDRATAERLHQDLRKRDIETFAFPPGENFVLEINRALTQSDYFVLLWSRASVDRPWVDAEWSAALVRDLQEQLQKRRSFLFVVRLDMTSLPPLLAPRQYLDAFDYHWDGLVNELAAIWLRDRAVGEPVLPAPCPIVTDNGEADRHGEVDCHGDVECRSIVLRVRNRALSVAHVIVVPEESTGQELESLVRTTLALPDKDEQFDGRVGMHFFYQLENSGEPISTGSRKLVELHIVDGDTIDLVVQVESFSPEGKSPIVTYRKGASTGLAPATTRTLINSAFGHLIPW